MRTEVLGLYKRLLRYGQTLRFTDKSYYRYRIRKGFMENKQLDDFKQIEFYVEKGRRVLENRKIV